MRSIQTSFAFPLSSVKPLAGLLGYRQRCLELTREALGRSKKIRRRVWSPVGGGALEPFGEVDGLSYARCPESSSLFLRELPDPEVWADLLKQVTRLRNSPEAFHQDLAQSRTDHVYAPKLEWMEETLRLQNIRQPRLLEVMTAPSHFGHLLRESGSFCEVISEEETALAGNPAAALSNRVQAAVLLESLDRADDPEGLMRGVALRLEDAGLLFVTALVASGFDVAVLGLRNMYLYPPDRANCFTLRGLSQFLQRCGFTLLEVSTPGVLDVEIVQAHLKQDPQLALSVFEQQLMEAGFEDREALQVFLQERGLSSFARIVARKSQ